MPACRLSGDRPVHLPAHRAGQSAGVAASALAGRRTAPVVVGRVAGRSAWPPPAGLRSKFSAPELATTAVAPADPRTTTEDRPVGLVSAPGRGPRDVVRKWCIQLSCGARCRAPRSLPAQAEFLDQRAVP